jgi:hypothetical protein
MKLGFTGTRQGMTKPQMDAFIDLVFELAQGDLLEEFHHGCCIGADEQAHNLLDESGVKRIGHPPENSTYSASLETLNSCDELRSPVPYLVRNQNIVDETDSLVAAPKRMKENLHSGTWYTVRMARKAGKSVTIIYPNGDVVYEKRNQ